MGKEESQVPMLRFVLVPSVMVREKASARSVAGQEKQQKKKASSYSDCPARAPKKVIPCEKNTEQHTTLKPGSYAESPVVLFFELYVPI